MTGAVLLSTDSLSVRFGGLTAVDDVSLSVAAGSIHGVIGPNGAGKSTFFNAVSGFVPISSGSVFMAGKEVTRLPPHARLKLGIQRTFQSVQLVKSMTVLENVMIGLHPQIALRPRCPFGRGAAALDVACGVAQELGLEDVLHKEVELLSFREQRQVEIARALVSRPRLLMLDEPAAGLSAREIAAFDDLLISLKAQTGLTILLVEHVMSLVMKVCDLITVLDAGRVIATGSAAEISADEHVIKAYLGDGLDA
ncbi:MAG TPA: ABC transporter ATP-binding protein [Stellaceae bacterium]|nr:ABC transporter ATP-binding protein [Stellaceae bacterium]